jgi:hypothetical protein
LIIGLSAAPSDAGFNDFLALTNRIARAAVVSDSVKYRTLMENADDHLGGRPFVIL